MKIVIGIHEIHTLFIIDTRNIHETSFDTRNIYIQIINFKKTTIHENFKNFYYPVVQYTEYSTYLASTYRMYIFEFELNQRTQPNRP